MNNTKNIRMGEYGAGHNPGVLTTILGSCVGLVLYDRVQRVGGIAHIILPETDDPDTPMKGKYANTAVPALITEMVKTGAVRKKITAKLFGGAKMFSFKNRSDSLINIGERNIEMVRELMKTERISILAENTGGKKGRKITLDTCTGQVTVEIMGEEKKVF